MENTMFSLPWQCGENDCQGWHKATYWQHGPKDFSVDSYTDGDHEAVSRNDLPTNEQVQKAWEEYRAFVAKMGQDPLNEYCAARDVFKAETWKFQFSKSILGPVLIGAKRGAKKVCFEELPAHVLEYLNLANGRRNLRDFKRWAELEQAVPGVKPGRWFKISIEKKVPRKEADIKKDLRKMATSV